MAAILFIGLGPAQTMASTRGCGLSLSASNRRCADAVKSVVASGAYSSWMTLALLPVAVNASLPALIASRPNA